MVGYSFLLLVFLHRQLTRLTGIRPIFRAFVLAVLLPGFSAFAQSGSLRIASINLCTDQLVLALADEEQVASITFLARHAESSYLADRAAGYHLNHGQAEELVSVDPDVVVAYSYISPTKLRFLNELGYRVEIFKLANNIAEVYVNLKRMAELLGKPVRGIQLVARMQERLDSVPPVRSGYPAPRGLIYEPNGYTGGRETLRGDILHHANWHNVATDAGISGVGVLGLEALLLIGADRLIVSPYAPGTHSLGQRLLQHPAIETITSGRPPVNIPIRHWICGGVMNVEALAQLVESRGPP